MVQKRSLESLKASFGAPVQEGGKTEFTNNYYTFWDMKPGQSCVIRFLPDLSEDNPRGFLVEKTTHSLTINGEKKNVPCLAAYGEDCPICKLSQEYYKAEDKINGKKYWRKKGYIAQALIIEDPLPPNKDTGETHVGKVRYISLGFQLYNIIKEAFASDVEPLEGIPYDFNDGYDFIIKKSQKGEYADYSVGTKFFSRQRALTEDELAVVGEHMIDLSTLLPKHPGTDKVSAMLSADINGGTYNEGASGDDEYRPSAPAPVAAKPAAKPAAVATPAPAPVAAKPAAVETPAPAPAAGASEVDDMLAAIRARRKQAA